MSKQITFEKYGDTFTEIKRNGQIAIFERTNPGRKWSEYEVVILRDTKEYTLNGVTIAAKEDAYPGSQSWGKSGWSFVDLNLAEEKFSQVVSEKCTPEGTVIVGKRGRKPNPEKKESVKTENGEPAKKGRKAVDRSELKFPGGEWSVNEAHVLNPNVCHATIYHYVKDLVKAGKMVECGKMVGGRGKAKLLYRVANENESHPVIQKTETDPNFPF
jgi:hypothetical protein